MKSLSSIFWFIVLALIFYVGFKVVPIYYKGILGIRGVCKQNADVYHKYGGDYIRTGMSEQLDSMGIPPNKREVKISRSSDSIVIRVYYHDSATFFERYTREFEFEYECEGVLRSVHQ
ncbi:MAG: hypothetical protein RIG61_13105 [Deltaproteobacteria bacterium]